MRSLKARLLVGMIGGMALLLIIFGLFVYTAMARALLEEFDASLTVTARTLAAAPELDEGEFELELEEQTMVEFQPSDRPDYFEFWLGDGTVLARSASLGKEHDLPCFAGPIEAPIHRPVLLPNGRPGRAVGIEFRPRVEDWDHTAGRPWVRLVVGRDTGNLAAELRLLRLLLLGGGAATVVGALLVSGLVIRHGLRPLSSLASRIAAIREDDLTGRIRGGPLPTEMLPVVERLNQLLARLEGAFERERCFTRDVAHELRTPLAGMRSTIEVALSRARTPAQYEESLADCLAIARGMQSMVDSFLMLARLETGQMEMRCERICLAELVDECWRRVAKKAKQGQLVFTNEVPPELVVPAQYSMLSLVLSNLVDNAVEYTNDGGQIWVTSRYLTESVLIEVRNTGCQLDDEGVAHVFDRFWQADLSRSKVGLHCGLGLALVRRAVIAAGGTTSAAVDENGIFAVRLVLPARP